MTPASPQPTVCIVIPCYKPVLRPFEALALQQCRQVLGAYDTFFMQPAGVDLSALASQYEVGSESFDAHYFKSVAGYNQLTLLDEFYARFAAYDYMLIHQLDAFVFRDDLLDWCRKGFDYIGAPWLPKPGVPSRFEEIYIKLRQQVARRTNRFDHVAGGIHGAQYMYAVGNGGFSLRKVARMRAVLSELPMVAEEYRRIDDKFHHEDIFFGVEANKHARRLKIPSYREAAGFAWEREPDTARQLNKGKLPFGCHGWNKLHRDEWRPVFAALGHSIDDLLH